MDNKRKGICFESVVSGEKTESRITFYDDGFMHISAGKKETNEPIAEVEPKKLNESLLALPAKTYLGLFREMHSNVYGYPPIVNFGGCCGSLDDIKDN